MNQNSNLCEDTMRSLQEMLLAHHRYSHDFKHAYEFNCHVNVELVASFKTLKYCFKYIHKGPDRAILEYDIDEIKMYVDGCYIGTPETMWQILHFTIHEQFPPVVCLQVQSDSALQ